ncbi:MAG TPA: hypothetical protein VL523_20435 [Terriglobia bacterium]|nr:hypothetical protein [Terriglobia bacterium]
MTGESSEQIAALHDAALDLYEKLGLIIDQLCLVGPSTLALKAAFENYDPRLAKLYFDNLEAAKQLPTFAAMRALQPLIARAVQTLKSHAN